jgi:hypothetical protein
MHESKTVPKTPKPGKVTMSVGDGPEVPIEDLAHVANQRDSQGLDTIRQYAVDLRDDADKVKAAEQMLDTIESTWPELQEVERLADELETAKQRLKQRREGNPSYLAQSERVAEAKRQKKEDNEILSDYLVAHFKMTGERQVLMNEANGDARLVNIKATLGKETKYQTSLDLAPGESA